MFAFRRAVPRASSRAHDRESLRENMTKVPDKIVDSLIARFTETTRGSTKCVEVLTTVQTLTTDYCRIQMTTNTEAKLLNYMFALCLRLDNYMTDHTTLAVDLAISTTS